MKKLMITSLIVVGITVGVLAGTSSAHHFDGHGKGHKFSRKKAFFKRNRLNLTPTQKQSLFALRIKTKKKMIPIIAKIKLQKLDLISLMKAKSPNTKAILAQVDKIGQLKIEMKKLKILKRIAAKSILTPEQLGKLKKMKRFRKMRRFKKMMRKCKKLKKKAMFGRF